MIHQDISHDVLCIDVKKQGDNIQPWLTPSSILNQSIASCLVLTVALDLIILSLTSSLTSHIYTIPFDIVQVINSALFFLIFVNISPLPSVSASAGQFLPDGIPYTSFLKGLGH